MVRFIFLSNARSGSCFFSALLRSSSLIGVTRELLDDNEEELFKDPIAYIEKYVVEEEGAKKFVGVKVFPEQLFSHNLAFDDLVRGLGAKIVLVLWRENTVETFVSRLIAQKTMCWFAKKPSTKTESVYVPTDELASYLSERLEEWIQIGSQWPAGIEPIFVKYEDLASDSLAVMKFVHGMLSVEEPNFEPHIFSHRQNPASLRDKVTNWDDLPDGLKHASINVPEILRDAIDRSLRTSAYTLGFAPDREPGSPPGGWLYRVSEPYIPDEAKANVMDALDGKNVLAGGYWPVKMAAKLKALFGCLVAKPCSNGFSAIFLALQVCDVGPGDEVVIPSFTTVAISNAIRLLNATPVLVDSLYDNYNPGFKQYSGAVTQKTKALIVTHTYGYPTDDLEKLVEFCHEKSIFLIENISDCLGATVNSGPECTARLLGTFGDLSFASLYANKLFHAGDGGFVIAKDPKLHNRLMSLANHGLVPPSNVLTYDVAINAEINGLGSALACGTLDHLHEAMERRKEILAFYRSALKETPLKFANGHSVEDMLLVFGVECENKGQRRDLRNFMARHGIETRNFSFPLHLQPLNMGKTQAYLKYNSNLESIQISETKTSNVDNDSAFPNAECVAIRGFHLPMHQQLTDADLKYICSVIIAFYQGTREMVDRPKEKPVEYHLRLKTGMYDIEIVTFAKTDHVKVKALGYSIHEQAFRVCLNAQRQLHTERWDNREYVRSRLHECIQEAQEQGLKNVELQLKPYMEYFDSQAEFEPYTIQPWLSENLFDPIYDEAHKIKTSTELETRQMLCWLIDQLKPKNVLELGCLFGHTTTLMASKLASIHQKNTELPKIYACDIFLWRPWMGFLLNKSQITSGNSFFNYFCSNTAKYSDIIKPIKWSLTKANKPQVLHDVEADLVFFDFTQNADELECIYQVLKPNFIPNKTVFVFNGISSSSIQFFTRNRAELTPLAQCTGTQSKTFLFGQKITTNLICKTLNFQSFPNWHDHCTSAFNMAIKALKDSMHDPTSSVMFIPSVESWLIDNQELESILRFQPWIGIIHDTVHFSERFHASILHHLCYSDRYRKIMASCQGLLTFTGSQRDYLNKHWPDNLPRIPIQVITYPLIEPPLAELPENVLGLLDNKTISLIAINSSALDNNIFFMAEAPANFQKVLLIREKHGHCASSSVPANVTVLKRLSNEDNEVLLRKSIVFLSLSYEGPLNTIIPECIGRNVPILCPKKKSCIEYLGEKYPLYYNDQKGVALDMRSLLIKQNIENCEAYLRNMDKARFLIPNFVASIRNGSVVLNVPVSVCESNITFSQLPFFKQYDVTILICSNKRTHHLRKILERLWYKQDFEGTMEIFIWNDNEQRADEVNRICEDYVKVSTTQKRLDVIKSTRNHFAAVRFAMPALMQSERLLISDDNILPNSNFVSYFLSASKLYLSELICISGQVFLPHKFDPQSPADTWKNNKNLKYIDDFKPNQLVHLAHTDACLIPKALLRECASEEMLYADFTLISDYWMSYILSHKFHRKLRKLSLSSCEEIPFVRTNDSDKPWAELYTQAEVIDAKLRLYMHHMLQGWPQWTVKTKLLADENNKSNCVKVRKIGQTL